MQIVNLLCAAFVNFTKMLGLMLAAILIGWAGLGWLAAFLLWGTMDAGYVLAFWLSTIIAGLWLLIGKRVESKVNQMDGWIESRSHAWKTR